MYICEGFNITEKWNWGKITNRYVGS